MARRVDIVPHTHWDREWHTPFQTFRLRLVDLLDGLLPQLEADPSYAHFLLDGQMAVVDDYLAVRPEAEERLRALAGSGRLAMGPWYALPDEFLVSGETLVRNLQHGLDVAARFGGAMEVGYLPDMFGHVAQMPQLLRQFGFEHAVVWRGVPSAIDRSGFWWSSPDGSTVRAEYLPVGLRQRRPRARRRQGARAPHRRVRGGAGRPARRPHPLDERHRPPHAPAVARAGRGRGQRARRRVRAAHLLAGRPRPRRAHRGPAELDGASCARARGPTCSWGWRPTAST